MVNMIRLLVLLAFPITAHAEPVTAVLGFTLFAGVTVGQVLFIVGMAVYGSAQQRKAQRKARDAFNNGLQDRTITNVATESPHVYVYGRARVGSSVVAIFTSGDKDQYKHLVCVHAAHECDAIEEIYISGKALGTLDASGNVTGGDYLDGRTELDKQFVAAGVTEVVLPYTPMTGTLSVLRQNGEDPVVSIRYTLVGNLLTLESAGSEEETTFLLYNYVVGLPRVRVQKHLGTPTDPADAYLMSVVPDKWTSTAVLRGFCYTVVTLDLNQPEFQGGIPPIEVVLRGKKLYDPRTGLTAWSQNPALVLYDYLTSEICNVAAADLPTANYITAANVCDEAQSFGARYLFNGTITSDQDQAPILEKIAQSMAGSIVSTTWEVTAGKYVAPVMALTQEDMIGSVAVTPGISDADLYNGVRGQYISAENSYVATDIKPFQNATYLATDRRELWTNIDFPYTDGIQRVHNLCRIFVEDQRNGYTVKAQFSLKAWKLKVGQRITLTSELFGWSAKIFRVTDKRFSPTSAVELTLKEDAASIWDFADAVEADSTPNSNLANPFSITGLASLTCASGTDVLLKQSDGTIVSRISATWPAITSQVSINGEIEIEWQKAGSDIWQKTRVNGAETQVYLSPVEDNQYYVVRGRAVDPYLNVKSNWAYATLHRVIGKTEPPADVAAFSITNGVLSWPSVTDLDLAGYQIRFHYGRNTSWMDATPLHMGTITESPWQPDLIPPGEVTLMIKAIDTTGNYSTNTSNIFHNFGDPIVDNLILSYDDKAAGFPGVKTNCAVVAGNLLADDSGDLFWGSDDAKFWGFDSAAFWPTATYKAATYTTSYTVLADEVGSRLTLLLDIVAASYTLEYRYDTQGEFWSNDSNFFWGNDALTFWPAPTEWATWPGAIESVAEGKIEFRITTQSGIVQGAVSQLTLQFDVDDEFEEIDDVSILAAGTRLPLTKTYRSIKNIQLTLQDDGGTAVSAKWTDKLATGPLIHCFNSAGTKVAGVIDARIQGIKG
jgi:hypothetical protein